MAEVEAPQETLDVDKILSAAPQFKSVTVEKDYELRYDLGRLCAFDHHPPEYQDNESLKEYTRENVQLLFTKVFERPTKVVTSGVLAQLPIPATILPRALPVPEVKEKTRWEKFAAVKGIKKKSRKPQLVWDETHKEYRRRFGYMRANNPEDQQVAHVSDEILKNRGKAALAGADREQKGEKKEVDAFTKMKADKKERMEKQGQKEKRNRVEAGFAKARVQSETGKKLKDDISRTFALVSRSTASLGRFDRRLPGEKEAPRMKGVRKTAGLGSAVGDFSKERDQSLALFDKMAAKEDKVNKTKAASQFMAGEQRAAQKRKREAPKGGFPHPKQKKREAEAKKRR